MHKLTLIYDWSLYHISRHDPQTHKKLKLNHMDALLIGMASFVKKKNVRPENNVGSKNY